MGAWQQRSQAGRHRRCDETFALWVSALVLIRAHQFSMQQFVSGSFFYGPAIFCCKRTEFCVMRCERCWPETRSFRDDVQRTENMRRNSFLNWKMLANPSGFKSTNIVRSLLEAVR